MTKYPSKILRLLCAVVLALSITLPSTVAFGAPVDETSGGEVQATAEVLPLALTGAGTEQDPFLISSPADLLFVAQQVNTGINFYEDEFLALTADINLASDEATQNWTPIGGTNIPSSGQNTSFRGSFYGNGHIISGMSVVSTSSVNSAVAGLFGMVIGATLQDFVVKGTISAADSIATVGGVVGLLYDSGVAPYATEPYTGSTILNIGSEVDIVANPDGWGIVGGVVGDSYAPNAYNVISSCYYKGTITAMAFMTGCIVGASENSTNISGCYSTGTIALGELLGTAIDDEFFIGGIVSCQTETSTLDACYNAGTITFTESGERNPEDATVVGAVIGGDYGDEPPTRIFYLEGSWIGDGGGAIKKTSEELQSPTFLTEIDLAGDYFKKGATYPILLWEPDHITNIENDFTIEGLNPAGYPYTATWVEPTVRVTDNKGTILDPENDYTVSYLANIFAGEQATVIVTGTGAYEGTLRASFTITPAPLTITAVAKEKALGTDDPELTYTSSGLKGEDRITSVTLTRTSGETAGSYDITASSAVIMNGGLNTTANYSITYAKGTFTITSPLKTDWPRLDGNKGENGNRFDTMQAIVGEGWTTSDTVIIAYSHDFPDALAASSLAGIYDAPVILTEKGVLTSQARDTIVSLKATKAYIIGGDAAVSKEVEDNLRTVEGITEVERVAGDNRLKTALAIYREGSESTLGWSDTAIVANGFNFADALSVSPFANATQSPIFLSTPTSRANAGLDEATLTALTEGGFKKVIITGGTAAVPTLVEEQLASSGVTIERWAGDTRYETSVDIVKNSLANSAGALTLNNLVCATGDNYPDALAGGAFAGHTGTILLLVHSTETGGLSGLDLIAEHKDEIGRGYVLGGAAAIPQELLTLLQEGAR
jgi:putative cell wall-binding protein